MAIEIQTHNQTAWDKIAAVGQNRYTRVVTPEQIREARKGNWLLDVSPRKFVPREWIPDPSGLDVLCLASGGGQQGPILAAAGANVTVLDISSKQLEQDRYVAQREGLAVTLEQGDMADLSRFKDRQFHLVINPPSTMFAPDVRKVWKEVARVLRPQGSLITGISNPAVYIFDKKKFNRGKLKVKYPLPYSDVASVPGKEMKKQLANGEPLTFSHTLQDQIGGMIDAGMVITGFYEDYWEDHIVLNKYMPCFMVIRAQKL